jgi:glutathione-regulated potassium-efflux system ancillary protein KefC
LIAAPSIFLILLAAKMAAKFFAVYPTTRLFKSPGREGMYTTLLMSTGLTFGSISALFGLSHGIIDTSQYSFLIATVVGSAVIPTLIANAFYLPRHLMRMPEEEKAAPVTEAGSETLPAIREEASYGE